MSRALRVAKIADREKTAGHVPESSVDVFE